MNAAIRIANWVEKKPMILIRFDEIFFETQHDPWKWFEHFTITKPHTVLQDCKVPTICLLEIQEWETSKCYLATVTRKVAVSTFDTRLTIKKLRSIVPSSLQNLLEMITDARMRRMLNGRISNEGKFSILSPKLSACVIDVLARDANNHAALDTAFSLLPRLRRASNANWAQENAIQTAIKIFANKSNNAHEEIVLKRNSSSGLGLIGAYLYEDNVVHADASLLRAPPKSLIGKAMHYVNHNWEKLNRYLEDGIIPIDNNATENAIRPFVVGRKNWLFSDTPKGAHANANLYTLIETVKGHGIEPYAYLRQVFEKLPQMTTVDEMETLLPWNLKTPDT